MHLFNSNIGEHLGGASALIATLIKTLIKVKHFFVKYFWQVTAHIGRRKELKWKKNSILWFKTLQSHKLEPNTNNSQARVPEQCGKIDKRLWTKFETKGHTLSDSSGTKLQDDFVKRYLAIQLLSFDTIHHTVCCKSLPPLISKIFGIECVCYVKWLHKHFKVVWYSLKSVCAAIF